MKKLPHQKLKSIKHYLWVFGRRPADFFFSSAGLIFCSPVFLAIALVREIELIYAIVFSESKNVNNKEKLFMWYEFSVLILFSPLFLIITLPLKIAAKDKFLFSTERRVGLRNRFFEQYKFKTEVKHTDNGTREQISPLGSFLIKTSLVKLPQLFNILKGDISFFNQSNEEPWDEASVRVSG